MTYDDYISQRVDSQIDWFDSKSKLNKNWYHFLKVIEILLALAIPFLGNYANSIDGTNINYLLGLIGVLIAFIAGILVLMRFQENWYRYRQVSESLKSEKFLFITKSGEYREDNSFSTFVEKIEQTLIKENLKWAQLKPGLNNKD